MANECPCAQLEQNQRIPWYPNLDESDENSHEDDGNQGHYTPWYPNLDDSEDEMDEECLGKPQELYEEYEGNNELQYQYDNEYYFDAGIEEAYGWEEEQRRQLEWQERIDGDILQNSEKIKASINQILALISSTPIIAQVEEPEVEEVISVPEPKKEEEEEVVDHPEQVMECSKIEVRPNHLNHSPLPSFTCFVGNEPNPRKRKSGTPQKWLDIEFIKPLAKMRRWTHQIDYRAHIGNSVGKYGLELHHEEFLLDDLIMEEKVSPQQVSNEPSLKILIVKKRSWRRKVNYRAFIGNVMGKCSDHPP